MNFAVSSYCGDERGLEAAAEPLHFAEGTGEGSRHLLSGHVAGREDKLADAMDFEGALFEIVVADLLVGGEEYPIVSSDEGQPLLIQSAPLEVGQVTLECDALFGESVEDRCGVAEVLVEVEDEGFRLRLGVLAPSGWPLRFLAACGHILRRGRRWTRGR